jgi:glycosyltransferase involved in cell wall biosynthesis
LRVCIWYWGRRGGGVRLTRELAEALRPDHRLSLSLSTFCEEPPEVRVDVPVHTVRTYRDRREFALSLSRMPAALASFRVFLRRTEPDVILAPMLAPWQALLLPVLGRWCGRIIAMVHDPEPHPGAGTAAIDWLSTRLAVRFAGRVVTLTEHSAGRIRRIAGRSVAVVPHGIPAVAAAAAAPRAFPNGRPFRFVFFGRLESYKGLGVLADAVGRLDDSREWEIEIVGFGPEEEMLQAVLGRHPRARLRFGWVPEGETDAIVSAADCLICPYTEASQSGVVVQAIAMALPSIVTPVGGLPEQVEHGRLGLIAKAVTAEAVGEAMRSMMADPERYEAFSKAAAEAARERYAWPKLIQALLCGTPVSPGAQTDGR